MKVIDASHVLGAGVTITVDEDGPLGGRVAQALQVPPDRHGVRYSMEGQNDPESEPVNSGGIAADRLRSIVERIERLEVERKALGADIKDIYSEAKSAGFDVKVLRSVLRIRKMDPAEVEEHEALLDLYKRALGMG